MRLAQASGFRYLVVVCRPQFPPHSLPAAASQQGASWNELDAQLSPSKADPPLVVFGRKMEATGDSVGWCHALQLAKLLPGTRRR
jgi:hypothetical protein